MSNTIPYMKRFMKPRLFPDTRDMNFFSGERILFFPTAFLVLFVLSINSAHAQFEYSYPVNGSKYEIPNSTIILRNGQLMDPNSLSSDLVTLTGSKSGVIPASMVLSTDGKTVCITPAVPFAYDENVSVNVKDGLKTLAGQILSGTSINFSIRRQMTEPEKQHLAEYLSTHDDDGNLINDPDQKATYVPPPAATERGTALSSVLIYTNTIPAPGKIFFNRNSGTAPQTSAERGYGIIESNGDSVFYRSSNVDGINFHLNLNGLLTAYHLDLGVDTDVIELDANYNIIDHVHCGNGFAASQHEHLFFPDGTKWFSVYDWVSMDLSQWGGGTVPVNISRVQELDANDNVIFEWSAADHFALNDAASDIFATISQNTYDPWHINAFQIDGNGIIISLRNMDRVIKIDHSGNIIWQWGGLGATATIFNQITTTGDPDGGFSHQHHVHRIDNGHILLFDNGNLQPAGFQQSKPKEYILDETNLTASCIWYYVHPQVNGFSMFTKNQGSAIRLPNENTIIGYGLPNVQGLPNGTEIEAGTGTIVWEFRFKDSTEYSYRVYKGDNNVGIPTVDFSDYINVFPNPSNGVINLSMDVPMDKMSISVLNLLGQTVYSKIVNSGGQKISLDLSQLDKGFYFLQITSGEKKMIGRILIQ